MEHDEALLHAIRIRVTETDYDRVGAVTQALERGANPNATCNEGISALHWACWAKLPQVVHVLLKGGADVHTKSPTKQQTPLHWACLSGDVLCVRMLIEFGASIQEQDHLGFSAIHFAAQQGHLFAIDYLYLHGADLEAKGYQGRTPFHCAMELDKEKAALFLLHLGANIGARDSLNRLPLHLAVEKQNTYLIRRVTHLYYGRFLSHLNSKNDIGDTPLIIANRIGANRIESHFQSMLSLPYKIWRISCVTPNGVPRADLFCANWTISWIILWQLHHFFILVPLESYSYPFHFFIFFLTTLSISSWTICRFSDPGFIPMQSLPSFPYSLSHIRTSDSSAIDISTTTSSSSHFSSLKNKNPHMEDSRISMPVIQAGGVYEWSEAYERALAIGDTGSLCHLCRVVKPHRAGHCFSCGRCVFRYDHHCPFVGNCVGEANHRPFLLFVTSTSLVAILYVWLNFILFRSGQLTFSDSIISALFAIHAFLMGIFVIGLSSFQLYLVSKNRSTNEHIKPHDHKYLTWDSRGVLHSPFDHGFISNVFHVLFADNRLSKQLTRSALASAQKNSPYPYPSAQINSESKFTSSQHGKLPSYTSSPFSPSRS